MAQHDPAGPMPEIMRGRLRGLRLGLLRLHKVLLEDERAAYERVHGRVESSGALLQLVIGHEWFAWLHAISELVVRIDELFDADEPATSSDALGIFTTARALLSPSEAGGGFGQKYFAALQREPAAVLAHREITTILADGV